MTGGFEEENSCPYQKSNHDFSVVPLIEQPLYGSAISERRVDKLYQMLVITKYKAGWFPELVWILWEKYKPLAPCKY